MKKFFTIAALAVLVVSCQQKPDGIEYKSSRYVEFNVPSFATKAGGVTPTESLGNFICYATTGSKGAETEAWGPMTFAPVSSGSSTYVSEQMWPEGSEDPGWHFYASNTGLEFDAEAGYTVTMASPKDIVCAYLPNPTFRTQNSLTFEHIYARIGRVDITVQEGFEMSGLSLSVSCPDGGVYNVAEGKGKDDGTGW